MTFYRYKHRYAHGDSKWDYVEFDGWTEEDIAENLMLDPGSGSFGEHYRGVTVEEIAAPPVEWLESELKRIQNSIKYYQERVISYESLIKELKK